MRSARARTSYGSSTSLESMNHESASGVARLRSQLEARRTSADISVGEGGRTGQRIGMNLNKRHLGPGPGIRPVQ